MSKDLMKTNPIVSAVIPRVLKDVNFEQLNAAITAIGNREEKLTHEEKTSAVTIIERWKHDVLSKLRAHISDIEDLLRFFDKSRTHILDNEDYVEQIAVLTSTKELYDKYITERERKAGWESKLREHLAQTQYELSDTEKTISEIALLKQENNLIKARLELEVGKSTRARDKALVEWKKAMADNEAVKDLVSSAKAYKKTIETQETYCCDKATEAIIAVEIDSPKIRSALKEFIDFTKTFM